MDEQTETRPATAREQDEYAALVGAMQELRGLTDAYVARREEEEKLLVLLFAQAERNWHEWLKRHPGVLLPAFLQVVGDGQYGPGVITVGTNLPTTMWLLNRYQVRPVDPAVLDTTDPAHLGGFKNKLRALRDGTAPEPWYEWLINTRVKELEA